MTIRNYHDFHLAINRGELDQYLIIERSSNKQYAAFGHVDGHAFSLTADSFRELRHDAKIFFGIVIPKLADLCFDHEFTGMGYRKGRSCVMYGHEDGTFDFVPAWDK